MAWVKYEGNALVVDGIYNMLRSGTFENEPVNSGYPNNWGRSSLDEISEFYVTNTSPITDAQSMFLRITNVGTNDSRPYLYQYYKDENNVTTPVQSGTEYKLDFLVRTNYTASTDNVILKYINLGGLSTENVTFTSSTAVTYSYDKVAASNQDYLGLYFDGRITGSVIIDNVRVYNLDYPTVATLESPADTSTDVSVSVELKWNTASVATDYNVIIDDNSDYLSPIIDTNTSKNYYPFTGSNNTTYYWKVTPRNNLITGSSSTSSFTASFTTVALATSVKNKYQMII